MTGRCFAVRAEFWFALRSYFGLHVGIGQVWVHARMCVWGGFWLILRPCLSLRLRVGTGQV